ncbi:hypothetical protein GCM10028895_02580 [Pontibacter rugosus]
MEQITTKTLAAKQSLEQRIQLKISEIAAVAEQLPGVVIIHNFQKEMAVEYISPRGTRFLGVSLQEIKELGGEYNYRFFNPEDAKDYVPKIIGLIERNNDEEIVTFFSRCALQKTRIGRGT